MRTVLITLLVVASSPRAEAACAAAGDPCDDGLFCTVADTCNASLNCVGLPRSCDDLLACTTDSCSEASMACRHIVVANMCEIGGFCYSAGTLDPANQCAFCDPALAPNTWSVMPGRACDDGLFCTVDDVCYVPVGQQVECRGQPRSCDDGLACTTDRCDETTDSCKSTMQTDYCQVDGVCYANGTRNPANDCEVCLGSVNPMGFTPRDGAPCDDGLFCTVGETCGADGQCSGAPRTCDDGDSSTTDSCDEDLAACVNRGGGGGCRIGADDGSDLTLVLLGLVAATRRRRARRPSP